MAAKGKKGKAHSDETVDDEFRELLHIRKVIIERLSRFEQYLLTNTEITQLYQLEIRLKSIEDDFQEFDPIQIRLEFLDKTEKQHRLETESSY